MRTLQESNLVDSLSFSGVIVSLISDPVTIGFVAGASLTISSSQIKSFLGLSGSKGSGFLGYIEAAIKNIGTITVGDTCLGFACVAVLLLFKVDFTFIQVDSAYQ